MLYAKITNLDAGWPYDQKIIKELHERFGDSYIPVKQVRVGRSSTDVLLIPVERGDFNSVNFTFYILREEVEGRARAIFEQYDIFRNILKLENVVNTYNFMRPV